MKRLLFLMIVSLFLLRIPLFTGCANIVPPSGGPRDSLPPVLITANPPLNALHFDGKKIVFNFDEYIDMKEIRNNLTVNPVPKIPPTVTSHLKTVTVVLKDTLQPNTTYSLNFGRAITDINEGNVLKNFSYTFSTGNYLDSIRLSGRVIIAYSGKPDSTLVAILHDRLYDSAVAKQRPRYVARLDSSGNYTFLHVKPGSYALYALKDESGTYEYTSPAQIFAFADSTINLSNNNSAPLLYAYQDTSKTWHAKKTPPKVEVKKPEKEKIKRLVLSANIPNSQLDLHDQFELSFQVPARYVDSTKIRFTTDSFVNIEGYHVEMDSTMKKLKLTYAWKENTGYRLILQKDFAEDTLGEKLLKIDTIIFRTKKESDYGNLRLRFRTLDLTLHPVLLFFQGDKLILSYPIGRSLRYNNKLFIPGEYELRILYDRNQNGVWDPGDFYQHLQPEIVNPIRKKLTVKGNWDNEVDITL
jgi:hypothetical protein